MCEGPPNKRRQMATRIASTSPPSSSVCLCLYVDEGDDQSVGLSVMSMGIRERRDYNLPCPGGAGEKQVNDTSTRRMLAPLGVA